MSVLNNSLLLGQEGGGGYAISRSLRFNSADSAYLSRTPASTSNRKTWTWAGWIKQSIIGDGSGRCVFSTGTNTSSMARIVFADETLYVDDTSLGAIVRTSPQYRDLSAWMHLVVIFDTTSATASSRIRVYVNGTQVTAFSTATYPTQNADGLVNLASAHSIGREQARAASYYSGYLADIHFIDGQALDPTSFGEFDATTGVWVPKAYTGTYGTNGFHLDFADNSAASAAALGKDTSGNANNWTPNNLSVSAGAGNDSLVDVPVNGSQPDTGAGGEVRGNYATLNPLDTNLETVANIQNGCLEIVPGASYTGIAQGANATIGVASGKWYFEGTPVATSGAGNQSSFGWTQSASASGTLYGDTKASCVGVNCDTFGNAAFFKTNGVSASLSNNTNLSIGAVSNDIFQIALDLDAGKVWIGKNGTWYNSGNPGTGTNPTSTFTNSGAAWRPWVETAAFSSNWNKAIGNFGQRPFAYTAPSGFKALCTANLPAPTIVKPSTAMDVVLYTGNGSSRSITGLGFNPDLVWIKSRSAATAHELTDSVRGVTKSLSSNTTGAEATDTNGLTAFNSDGFSLGTDTNYNNNNATYAGWCWDAGSTTVTNTQGSITSSVRANASAGFSVVTASVEVTAAAPTIGHGLGVKPGLVIGKNRSATVPWYVWHSSLGTNQYLVLNTTAATATAGTVWGTIGSSTIQMGIPGTDVGSAWIVSGTQDVVFYCFAPVAGYSAFGSYTGNGSADGPFVYLGFRPALVIVKMSSSTGDWTMLDTKREGYNIDNDPLFSNLSDAEGTTDLIDITSNGFKVRTTNATFNTNAGTYVFAAWAESPFQYSRAR